MASAKYRTCTQYFGIGAQLTLLQPLANRVDVHTARLRDHSCVIADLLATTRQQHAILVGVFDCSIPLPQTAAPVTGPPRGGPYVSQTDFASHLADSTYERSILSQGVSRGGITIDDYLFTVLQDATAFVTRHFPA